MCFTGSGLAAGPWATEPSAIWNWLPWQGQSMVPSATRATVQPSWVQIAEKALNSPFFGCVTTTFTSLKIVPPPTGTSAVPVSSRPAGVGVALGVVTDTDTDLEVAGDGGTGVEDPEPDLVLPHPTQPAANVAA